MSVYELRVYDAAPGRMEDLLRRFRDHTVDLFREHGIESLGYWVADDDPNRLVYLVKHEDGAFDANWKGFRADPRWISVRDESQRNGSLTTSVTSTKLHRVDVGVGER